MNFSITNKNDEIVMSLVHYFITEENYSPIMVRGVKDEIWLENLDGPYRIIRINSNHIHNIEQYNLDIFKAGKVLEQIKKKTLSLKVNTLNILINVDENLDITEESKNISNLVINDMSEITNNKSMLQLFPKMKNKLIQDKEGIELIINVTNDINAKTVQENEKFNQIFGTKRSIVTPLLIVICIIMFVAMYIIGAGSEDVKTLIKFGANVQALVKAGEVWRLISSIFLHIGILHLLFNMYALYILGRQLENFMGKIKYLIIFLGSGIIGSLFSVVFYEGVSAGASGAIFGLLGSLLYFGYHYRLYLGTVLKTQIIPVTVINLILGFALPGIGVAAHIGGLVGGYLFTMILGIPGKKRRSDQINGAIVLTILVAFLSYLLIR